MIRTGLIGFGAAGSLLHAPLIAAEPRLRLTAVASSRADAVRARLPDVAVTGAQALVADAAIDLVMIATPNAQHAPLARAALLAGKHVVVDKPFVADAADGATLIALAAKRGRVLSVFHNRRWDADFLTVRAVLAGGRLGRVRFASLCWDRFRPAIKPGWREQPGAASGVLADLGPHLIDQALQLFGPPDTVTAQILAQREDAATDDYFAITLGYTDHQVELAASTLVAAPRPRFALHGERGSFVKHGLDPQEAVLRGGGSPDSPGFGEEAADAWGTLTDAAGVTRVPSERGDWRHFYAGVAAAILDGAPPPVDPADALAGLEIIARARASAAQGRTLAI